MPGDQKQTGRWVLKLTEGGWIESCCCSVCGQPAPAEGIYTWKFTEECPRCGARMSKERVYEKPIASKTEKG